MSGKSEIQDQSALLASVFQNLKTTPGSYIDAARQIERYAGDDLRSVSVSVLSSFTAEILRPYVVTEAAKCGLRLHVHFCPFNQIEVQTLDRDSELYQSNPEVVIVAQELADIAPLLVQRYVSLSVDQIHAECDRVIERYQDLIADIRQQSEAAILLWNFGLPLSPDAGLADASLEFPQTSAVHRINSALSDLCRTLPGVYIIDYFRFIAEFGMGQWYDSKLKFTARIPFSMKAQLEIGRQMVRYVRALLFAPCKCLVLDLDNTLWGGVIGEDGLGGIQLGEDYPGNVYKSFQRRLLSLRDQGILLAIASKNNESDVKMAINSHPDMVLRLEDFSATQIHWEDKAQSLIAIARELNIGLDAVAFFDDSPVERERVRQCCPAVTVIDVPSDPMGYLNALETSGVFDRFLISTDDRRRADMVRESHNREAFRVRATSVNDFLSGLNMVATVGRIGSLTLPRVVQLLQKTNQFNLTTRRHSATQLQTMLESGAIGLWLRLRDRFGDSGLVGVVLGVREDEESLRVDTLLLSCRVIGRRVEDVLLGLLAQQASCRGYKNLLGEYIPTLKNAQVSDFYPSRGFQSVAHNDRCWIVNVEEISSQLPDCIRVEHVEEEKS